MQGRKEAQEEEHRGEREGREPVPGTFFFRISRGAGDCCAVDPARKRKERERESHGQEGLFAYLRCG